MKLVSRRRPAEWIRHDLSEDRVEHIWRRVAEHDTRRRPVRLVFLLAAAMMVACVGLLVLGAHRRGATAPTLEATAEARTITLADGSRLELAGGTRLAVLAVAPTEVRLRLELGAVSCDVSHQPERRFSVEAGSVVAEARGTRFRVARQPGKAVSVEVEQGAVAVRDTVVGEVGVFRAGQAWTQGLAPPVVDSATPSWAPPPASARPPAVATPKLVPSSASTSAKQLFDEATEARLAGRHRDAARALARLVEEHPQDGRAPLAAYQLGRIRLGLGEPAKALAAFDFAVRRGGASTFREDAMAGRVDAANAMGDSSSCKLQRDAFAKEYPASVINARLGNLCGGP